MHTGRPIDQEDWGVEDINDYPIWREFIQEQQATFDMAVFHDYENIKTLIASFSVHIKAKFISAAESITNDIIGQFKVDKLDANLKKTILKLNEARINSKPILVEHDPDNALLYHALNNLGNNQKIKHNELIAQYLQFKLVKLASQTECCGEDIKQRSIGLVKELSIWTPDRIYKACLYYVEYAVQRYKNTLESNFKKLGNFKPNTTQKVMEHSLVSALIERFIEPIKEFVLQLNQVFQVKMPLFGYGSNEFTADVKMIYYKIAHNVKPLHVKECENNILDATKYNSIQQEKIKNERLERESAELLKQQEINRANNALNQKLTSLQRNIPNLDEDIATYPHLRKALIAAYDYLEAKRESCWSFLRHGEDGRKATILFMQQLVNMPIKSLENVQDEALQFLRAEGPYAHTYASNYHKTSRSGFIVDSGLLQGREKDIPKLSRLRSKHQQLGLFRDLEQDDRVAITEQVKALPLSGRSRKL